MNLVSTVVLLLCLVNATQSLRFLSEKSRNEAVKMHPGTKDEGARRRKAGPLDSKGSKPKAAYHTNIASNTKYSNTQSLNYVKEGIQEQNQRRRDMVAAKDMEAARRAKQHQALHKGKAKVVTDMNDLHPQRGGEQQQQKGGKYSSQRTNKSKDQPRKTGRASVVPSSPNQGRPRSP
eukprot:Platyproteum_vivax@DN12907_c0_g1_i1.p1